MNAASSSNCVLKPLLRLFYDDSCLLKLISLIFKLSIHFLACTGHKYYYNTRTHVSQWEPPSSSRQVATQQFVNEVSEDASTVNWHLRQSGLPGGDQSSDLKRCTRCGGWGVGLVQLWGYCNHCTR